MPLSNSHPQITYISVLEKKGHVQLKHGTSVSLLSSFKCINKRLCIVCMHACKYACAACMHACTVCLCMYDLRECVFQWFTEALCEKEQSMVAYDAKFAQLQVQVEQWKATAKESQGKVIG